MKGLLIVLSMIILSSFAQAQEVKTFTSDFCTGYPEGTLNHPNLWRDCCIEHDLYLWAGGTQRDHDQTDLNLMSCVKKVGAPINADIIFWGIKLGNLSPIKLQDKKWSNAWITPRGLKALSFEEIDMLQQSLDSHPSPYLSPEDVDIFIENLRSRIDR